MRLLENPFSGAITSALGFGGLIYMLGFSVGSTIGALDARPALECYRLGQVAGGGATIVFLNSYLIIRAWPLKEYWRWKRIQAERDAEETPDKVEPIGGDVQRFVLDVDAAQQKWFTIHVDAKELSILTDGLALNRSLSVRTWGGKDRLFSQPRWISIVKELEHQELVELVGDTKYLNDLGVRAFAEGRLLTSLATTDLQESYPLNTRPFKYTRLRQNTRRKALR